MSQRVTFIDSDDDDMNKTSFDKMNQNRTERVTVVSSDDEEIQEQDQRSDEASNCAHYSWWFLAGIAPIALWAAIGMALGEYLNQGESGKKFFLNLKKIGTITLGSATAIGAMITVGVIFYGCFKSTGSIEDAKKALFAGTIGPVACIAASCNP